MTTNDQTHEAAACASLACKRLEAAGYRAVKADRLDRQIRVAANAHAMCFGLGSHSELLAALRALRSGDLDGGS